MRKAALCMPLMLAALLLCSGQVLAQPSKKVTVSGDDLHYLGYVMLTGDTLAWANITNDDVFHLSKGMYYRKVQYLNFIQDDNLFFFGNALLTADRNELQKITADDWYYLGSAMFERTVAYLENITDDDVYYLGKAIIQRDFNFLNQLSGGKE
jgi:hypothetical protein